MIKKQLIIKINFQKIKVKENSEKSWEDEKKVGVEAVKRRNKNRNKIE